MVDSLVQENISGGEPSVSELNIVQLCDQYTTHCPSTKEFEDQSLPLWRNLHIHRSGLVLDVYTQIQGVLKAYSRTKRTIFKELKIPKTRHAGRQKYQKQDISWQFTSLHARPSSNISLAISFTYYLPFHCRERSKH